MAAKYKDILFVFCQVSPGPSGSDRPSRRVAASLLLTSMPEFGVYEQTYKELHKPWHVHASRLRKKVAVDMVGQFSTT